MTDATGQTPLSRLLRYAKGHNKQIHRAVGATVLNKLFDLAPPLLIGVAVDIVVKREASFLARMGLHDVLLQLWVLAFLTVLVWGLESIFEYAYARLWRDLAQTIQHDLRLDAYAHLQDLQMAYFADQSTGDLMAILNDDVNQLERFLDNGASDLILIGTSTLVIALVFFAASPAVAALAILPLPFVLWGSFQFQKRIAPHYAKVRHQAGMLNGQLANNIAGIETIKSYAREQQEVERISQLSDAYRRNNKQAIKLSSAFAPLIRMVIAIGFVGTLVLGGTLTLKGLMSVGVYSVLVFLTQRLLWPLTRLGATFDQYQRAMASTERILNLLDAPITVKSGDIEEVDGEGDIHFEDIDFAYGDRSPLFEQLDIHIGGGQTVAFVGATGSGKSTLIKLLLRFYDVQRGRVTLGGRDLRQLPLSALRRVVALVSQHVYLFSGTVKENIAYGRLDATQEDIERAARMAEAHDFIEALPNGYDTEIGERGQKLSGGQRQRISIARAILKDAPILVFDEATSAVDNETEAAIQRSLSLISEDKTTLLIAHRLSTIRHADRIFVLEGGQVQERGDHEQLLKQGGIYARLWRVQTGEKA